MSKYPPLGRKLVPRRQAADMWRPLVAEMAAGRVPIDESTASLYGMVLDEEYRKLLRELGKET